MRVVFSAFSALVLALLALLFQDRNAIAAAHASRTIAAPPSLVAPCATEVVEAPPPCAATGEPGTPASDDGRHADPPGGPPPWVRSSGGPPGVKR